MRPLIRAGIRDLIRRPLFSGLMLAGLTLGVSVVTAIDLASQSAARAFELSTDTVVGRATHRVIGGPTGVPEELYAEIRSGSGITQAAPVVEGLVSVLDFEKRPMRILGVDLFAEAPFRDHLGPELAFDPDFQQFFTEPGMVILGEELAAANQLAPGTELAVQVNDRLETLTILGIVSTFDSSDILLMDIAAAQELLGASGRLSWIDLIVEDPGSVEKLRSQLPSGLSIISSSQQRETADQLTSAFRLNLTALSLLALVVGFFLVYNTMTFSVLSRRSVLGTLRSLGVSGEQVFAQVVLEAALVGLAGSLLGILLGLLLAQFALALVTRTINDFYFLLTVREVTLTTRIAVKAIALGVGAGAMAAIVPALEASRVPPIQVLRRSEIEEGARVWAPRIGLIGLVLTAAGSALFMLSDESLARTFFGILVVVLGLAMMVPLATQIFMRLFRPLSTRVHWRLAVRGVTSQLSRGGIAIAALMVALSVTIGIALMISSFRATVENWLNITLYSDIYVSSPAVIGNRPQANLSPSLEGRLAQMEGVATVEAIRTVRIQGEFGELDLTAVDPRRVRDAGIYRFASGSASQVWDRVREGAVVISESLVFRHGTENALVLETDAGPRTFEVVGVFYDYSSDRGTVLMSREIYLENWDDPALSSLGVQALADEGVDDLAESIRAELAGTGLAVQDNQEIREEALRIFDRTFAITESLRILAVVIAFVGILSALLALQLERTREYATLQAIGLAPEGLEKLTYLETALMGLSASLLALPVGLLLAMILIHVINVRSFGWTIQLAPAIGPFLQAILVGVAASLAAAVYPVSRLRKMPIAAALRGE
ncbi:MAG: FtsX-like permease family protein [Anaerolineae bacterium]|nr:MAG: FtsX-like permease family protein [Anaerolineae bacterium]